MQSLGQRMKENYEDRTRIKLPRRTNVIIRLDGKAFHTFTRNLNRPFDHRLMSAMHQTSAYICSEIQGSKLSYTQSDEISIWLTDYDTLQTDMWFDGNIQKMCSVAASLTTAYFNRTFSSDQLAVFDARVFVIPKVDEVVNYFIWRQQDASRNSVHMLARSLYSHKECMNKNNSQLQDMIHEKGKNWNDLTTPEKRGVCVLKKKINIETEDGDLVNRNIWYIDEDIPIFSQNRQYITEIKP
jgi:tRNA(His) guanylyltransferase